MNYYLISSKEDDYGNCRNAVYYGEEKNIKKYVYYYQEIPKEHYEILKKYHENLNEGWYEDYGYKKLSDYLGEYYS